MPTGQPIGASRPLAEGIEVRAAREDEADELLPLMRAYCVFYGAEPDDEGLLTMMRSLATNPEQGALFCARDAGGNAIGVATMDWKWSSTRGSQVGYLEDLFVDPDSRGGGVADALIEACAERCRENGVPALLWQTATDNHRAQQVYERLGASGSTWLEYELEL
ncbi:MAG: GNAT family N-acetyltransferase [Solirubrobacterales bacterium]